VPHSETKSPDSLPVSLDELRQLLLRVDTLSTREAQELYDQIDRYTIEVTRAAARLNLLDFCVYMNPDFLIGSHHILMAEKLEALARGDILRLAISMPPRHGKSVLCAQMFPAWYLGHYPTHHIIGASNTAALAEDNMGRVIRDLIMSEPYIELFPKTKIRTDASGAGRWMIANGGIGYFVGADGNLAGRGSHLCVSPSTLVRTLHGWRAVADIKVGDSVWGFSGFNQVQHKMEDARMTSVVVDGLSMTVDHPVWTFNRGWVPAGLLTTFDVIYSGHPLARVYNYVKTYLVPRKKHLVANAAALLKPKSSKLHKLWRSGYSRLRRMGDVCSVLRRHGGSADIGAYTRSNRQRWALHTGELPVGFALGATEQQNQQRTYNGLRSDTDTNGMGARDEINARYNPTSDRRHEDDTRRSIHYTENELGSAPRYPDEFGWLTCSIARVISGGRKSVGGSSGIYMGRLKKWLGKVGGLLLGVRAIRSIEPFVHEQRTFVDLSVTGCNTLYARGSIVDDPILLHNCIVDDPHSERSLQGNVEVNFDSAYEWYQAGPRQRLMANGKILIIHTRWHKRDMIGRVLDHAAKNPDGDKWEYLELPALLPNGQALWPEMFTKEALEKTRGSMAPHLWSSQYQQQPTSAESAVVKQEYFKRWTDTKTPDCDYILGSLDTAMEATTRSDYNAMTVWGVFKLDQDRDNPDAPYQIMLLDLFKKRMEYPELKKKTIEWYKDWEMDSLTIERKNSGASLIQDLVTTGILASSYRPGTRDKISRLNSVVDILASGLVWIPDGYRWADEFIAEICGFPTEPNDDLVDSMVMALTRFREGGFVTLPDDWTVGQEAEYDTANLPALYWGL
jgi:predicted phage terminase large subunit-like protein